MRLTLLTPRTMRIQQRRDSGDVYDDRSSFAIVNRLLPVPSFTAELSGECELLNAAPRCLVITTSRLRIEQSAPSNATTDMLAPRNGGGLHAQWQPPTPSSSTLRVRLILDAVHQSTSLWWPGKANPRQLPGTIRTLTRPMGRRRCAATKSRRAAVRRPTTQRRRTVPWVLSQETAGAARRYDDGTV